MLELHYKHSHGQVLLEHLSIYFQHWDHVKHPVHFAQHATLTQNTQQMCPHKQMGWREALPEERWAKLFHSQPSDSEEPKDRGICCQLMAAHRCMWPGHAPTCTAKAYPVYCADMLIYPQGKHSWTQEPQEEQWNHTKTRGHAKHLRMTKKGEKSSILHKSFHSLKLKESEQKPFSWTNYGLYYSMCIFST